VTDAMKSSGVVIDIIEKRGRTLVCFSSHDGVFTLPPGNEVFYAKVTQSLANQKEISFTYDGELNFLSIE
jgi:hypothetical protein